TATPIVRVGIVEDEALMRAMLVQTLSAQESVCPASSCWQVLGLGKVGGQRVGQAQVDLQGPVPGDRLVRPHGVVLGPVVVGVRVTRSARAYAPGCARAAARGGR